MFYETFSQVIRIEEDNTYFERGPIWDSSFDFLLSR